MATKAKRRYPKKCGRAAQNMEVSTWNPERMLDVLMRNHYEVEQDWVEKGLPKLVDEMLANYQEFGGIDHLTGRDLPSKKVVVEVLEDLFTILFRLFRQGRSH